MPHIKEPAIARTHFVSLHTLLTCSLPAGMLSSQWGGYQPVLSDEGEPPKLDSEARLQHYESQEGTESRHEAPKTIQERDRVWSEWVL